MTLDRQPVSTTTAFWTGVVVVVVLPTVAAAAAVLQVDQGMDPEGTDKTTTPCRAFLLPVIIRTTITYAHTHTHVYLYIYIPYLTVRNILVHILLRISNHLHRGQWAKTQFLASVREKSVRRATHPNRKSPPSRLSWFFVSRRIPFRWRHSLLQFASKTDPGH